MMAFQRIAEERHIAERIDRLTLTALGSQGSSRAIKTELERMKKVIR
jgi:hypothetical protein